MKLLLVEDQEESIPFMKQIIVDTFSKYFPGISNDSLTVATTYRGAEDALENVVYDYVLLDNSIPGFEGAHFNKHGYELIPAIKARTPSTIIIGTSSMLGWALTAFPKPDYSVGKFELREGLEKLLEKIKK